MKDFANMVSQAVSDDVQVSFNGEVVKKAHNEYSDILNSMTREQLQTMCEQLLDNEKQMRKELDEIRGIIR